MMPDMEKVIAWLNEIVNTLGSFTDDSEQEVCQLAKDALAMLKDQKAVEPKTEPSAKGYWYTCGVCGWWLFEVRDTVHFDDRKRIHFCASCGKAVKWE